MNAIPWIASLIFFVSAALSVIYGRTLVKNRKGPMRHIVLVCIGALLTCSSSLQAFEGDVHYGLTRYLAERAGWSADKAEAIACANQGLDENDATAATSLVIFHIILGDQQDADRASNLIKTHHFPTLGKIPDDPQNREVKSDSKDPVVRFEKARALGDLIGMGEALHSYQDSWSHQGIPDIPVRPFPRLRLKYSWGHPRDRGGWWNHNADLTYMDKPDAVMDMAEQTFLLLGGDKGIWGKLKDELKLSVSASTWEDKRDWFDHYYPRNDFPDRRCMDTSSKSFAWSYVQNVNLRSRDVSKVSNAVATDKMFAEQTSSRYLLQTAIASPTTPAKFSCVASTSRTVAPQLGEFANWFLSQWILDQQVSAAVELGVDVKEIDNQLRAGEFSEPGEKWIRRFLTLWLVADHGTINEKGHGMPGTGGYNETPIEPGAATSGRYRLYDYKRFGGLQNVLRFNSERPFYLGPLPEDISVPNISGQAFALAFRFRRLPHDAVTTIIACREGTWKIIRAYWVAS